MSVRVPCGPQLRQLAVEFREQWGRYIEQGVLNGQVIAPRASLAHER